MFNDICIIRYIHHLIFNNYILGTPILNQSNIRFNEFEEAYCDHHTLDTSSNYKHNYIYII
jgi:hypothetical protein